MPYVIRNSVIIGTLLIIAFFIGILLNATAIKKLETARLKYNDKIKGLNELKRLNPDLQNQKKIIATHDILQKKSREEKKRILKEENPTISYQYFMDICDNYCPNFNFNFTYNTSIENTQTNYNSYELNGVSYILDIYKFIYQIEMQSPLYTIESLSIMDNIPQGAKTIGDTVEFNLKLNAYFDQAGTEIQDIPMEVIRAPYISYNPFYFRIHYPVMNNENMKYIDVDAASLIALTPKNVIMSDKSGNITKLTVGDKVAFGYLSGIDWENHSAVFRLNKIGIPTKKTIYLKKD